MSSEPDVPETTFQCVCGTAYLLSESRELPAACPDCGRRPAGASSGISVQLQETVIAGDGDTDSQSGTELSVGPGDQLDHFTVTELIGAGGMGAVFKARDESLQRFVAVKVIRGAERNPALRDRLIHEARAQARVQHPGIIPIHYVGMHQQRPFFAMELVDGRSLAARMEDTALNFGELVGIALQAVKALRHSAELGVVHGDVKPANIMLTREGAVKLSDFGLAGRSDDESGDTGKTGPAGTLNYMAPEVAGGSPADEQSDMYSLGVMLYELTFGRLPIQMTSETLADQLQERRQAEILFPTRWPSTRPPAWRGVLERLLAKNREQRFSDYAEVEKELVRWRPPPVREAGRLQRAVAWLVDTVIGAIVLAVIAIPVGMVRSRIGGTPQIEVSSGGPLVWLALLLSVWLHIRWKRSPGKKLMQLRIVDRFGLTPPDWKMTVKAIGTWLLFWMGSLRYAVNRVTDFFFGTDPLEVSVTETGIIVAVMVLLLLNAAWLVVSRRKQTALDYFLEVRVVLDNPAVPDR